MARVRLEGVRKIYTEGAAQVAVDRVDLDVKDGEFVVLVGPSGCGKSTTLRMIAGLESISAGTVKIGDRVVNDVPPKARDIAMVFQNYALYPHMSVRENLGFALKLRNMPADEIDKRVGSAATTLGLEDYLDRKPRQLSGGQRQRVALGRAIVRQPQVFLFDEPLSNLDAQMRVSMRREIARLHQELKVTMIYVTHDQIEAMTLGDRIVVMNKGHVMQIDTPINLYEKPKNKFVAGFIGNPAMNFANGTDRGRRPVALRGRGRGMGDQSPVARVCSARLRARTGDHDGNSPGRRLDSCRHRAPLRRPRRRDSIWWSRWETRRSSTRARAARHHRPRFSAIAAPARLQDRSRVQSREGALLRRHLGERIG